MRRVCVDQTEGLSGVYQGGIVPALQLWSIDRHSMTGPHWCPWQPVAKGPAEAS